MRSCGLAVFGNNPGAAPKQDGQWTRTVWANRANRPTGFWRLAGIGICICICGRPSSGSPSIAPAGRTPHHRARRTKSLAVSNWLKIQVNDSASYGQSILRSSSEVVVKARPAVSTTQLACHSLFCHALCHALCHAPRSPPPTCTSRAALPLAALHSRSDACGCTSIANIDPGPISHGAAADACRVPVFHAFARPSHERGTGGLTRPKAAPLQPHARIVKSLETPGPIKATHIGLAQAAVSAPVCRPQSNHFFLTMYTDLL